MLKITRNIAILSALLGLTWGLGFLPPALSGYVKNDTIILNLFIEKYRNRNYLIIQISIFACRASESIQATLQLVFIMLNGSMGVYIFLYSVVFNKKVRVMLYSIDVILIF